MSATMGLREKTIEERIWELANPDLCKTGEEAEVIIKMLHDERARQAEQAYRTVQALEKEISQLRVEIRAIVGYIQYREA